MSALQSPPLTQGPHRRGPGVQFGWRITSYFGVRADPITGRAGTGHGGEDLGADLGTPILAVVDGWVSQAWDPSGGGNWSALVADADGAYYGYGHASRFADGGTRRHVKAGEVIAYVGSTGKSTGAHLHFAYRPPGSGSYADPFDLLQAVDTPDHATTDTAPAPAPENPTAPAPTPIPKAGDMLPTYKTSNDDARFYIAPAADGTLVRVHVRPLDLWGALVATKAIDGDMTVLNVDTPDGLAQATAMRALPVLEFG